MLGEALSIAGALSWAASTVLLAETLKDIDPLSVNALKTLFAVLSTLPIALVMGELQNLPNLSFYGFLFVTLAAIIGFGVGDTLLFKSINLIGVSRSYTIAYTYPLFTIVFAVLFLSEPFLLKYLLGTVMIFIGVVGVSVSSNAEVNRENYRGLLAALATAILWAIGTVLVALGLNEMSTILANTVRFPLLFIFLLPVSRFWRKKLRLTKRDWIFLATSGILGMTLGGIAFLFSVQLIGASRATSLSSSSPVLASLMSSFFLKEKVTWRVIASSIMVVLGIYFLT